MSHAVADLLNHARELQRADRRVIACLLVNARGSTPQSAGALMLVEDTARLCGTVGGGCVEAEVRRRAHQMLISGETGLLRFKLNSDYGWDDGLICGGTVEIAVGPLPPTETLDHILIAIRHREATSLPIVVETEDGPVQYTLGLPAPPRLIIAGAGHIGSALASHGVRLEFDVTLVDDREDLLAMAAPPGTTTRAGEMAETLRDCLIDQETYCVIVTRGHRHDGKALHAVIKRDARYIGMIGSRRKIKLIFDELAERGVPREALSAVHAPIGLDIGAVSVEEIAISIAAELVAVRRATRRSYITGPMPVPATLTSLS